MMRLHGIVEGHVSQDCNILTVGVLARVRAFTYNASPDSSAWNSKPRKVLWSAVPVLQTWYSDIVLAAPGVQSSTRHLYEAIRFSGSRRSELGTAATRMQLTV